MQVVACWLKIKTWTKVLSSCIFSVTDVVYTMTIYNSEIRHQNSKKVKYNKTKHIFIWLRATCGYRGSTVVKMLCYNSEGRGFDSRWCHWNFSLTESFRSHYGPGVDSASNRNEYQEYFLGIKAAGA